MTACRRRGFAQTHSTPSDRLCDARDFRLAINPLSPLISWNIAVPRLNAPRRLSVLGRLALSINCIHENMSEKSLTFISLPALRRLSVLCRLASSINRITKTRASIRSLSCLPPPRTPFRVLDLRSHPFALFLRNLHQRPRSPSIAADPPLSLFSQSPDAAKFAPVLVDRSLVFFGRLATSIKRPNVTW